MLIDKRLELSDAHALAASARSTNVIDLGTAREIGAGRPLWLIVSVDVAADATTGDETYNVALETDSDPAFGTPTVLESRTIAPSTLVAGYQTAIAIPPTGVERYISANYTLAGTTPSVTVSAWVSDQEPRSWKAYPDAI